MTNRQKEFCKLLTTNDHRERNATTFERWAEMAFCALSKPMNPETEKREARYMQLVGKVEPERAQHFAEMLSIVALGLEETEGRDFLGPIVSELEFLNAGAGQFFTPFDLAELMARMTMPDALAHIAEHRFLTVSEPAGGAGAMVLAAARVFREQGADVMRDVWFELGDVSSLCYHMAFIQMALCGLSGDVLHQNTLTLEHYDRARLPMSMYFLARHGHPHRRREIAPAALVEKPQMGQLAFL